MKKVCFIWIWLIMSLVNVKPLEYSMLFFRIHSKKPFQRNFIIRRRFGDSEHCFWLSAFVTKRSLKESKKKRFNHFKWFGGTPHMENPLKFLYVQFRMFLWILSIFPFAACSFHMNIHALDVCVHYENCAFIRYSHLNWKWSRGVIRR